MFLMRSWISYASVGARNNKIVQIFTLFFGILSLQKAYYFVGICFLLLLFHRQASMFFYIMMSFLESLFIIILFGDFF